MDRDAVIEQIADNLHRIKREMQNHLLKTSDATDLSPAQMELLKQIRCKGPLSHKELAAEARLTPGAVTQLLDGLDANGCIVRSQSPDDRRVSFISISPVGEQKLDAAITQFHKLLFAAYDALDDDELLAYAAAQRKLVAWHEAHCSMNESKKE
jgi:DNA-binding MarR family transcriptional regulator